MQCHCLEATRPCETAEAAARRVCQVDSRLQPSPAVLAGLMDAVISNRGQYLTPTQRGVKRIKQLTVGDQHLPLPVIIRVRIAPGALHHLDGRQQRVHAARHDALGGAAAAHDGDAAQPVVHAAQQQCLRSGSGSGSGSGSALGRGHGQGHVTRCVGDGGAQGRGAASQSMGES